MNEQAALLLLRGLYQARQEAFTALCHALSEARQDFPGIDFWS